MKKPIYRVFITYEIKSKNSVRGGKKGVIDTFATTDNLEDIKKDEVLINRICYLNKKKLEKIDVILHNIEIEGQYGETIDRFPDE